MFKHNQSLKTKAIIPIQEFYAPEESTIPSGDSKAGSYYPFRFDTNLTLKRKLLEYAGNDSAISQKPWKLVNSEKTLEVEIDNDLQLIKASTNQDKLALVYMYLCSYQPEKALSCLTEMSRGTGLTGSVNELLLLEKIMNGVPREHSKATIKDPRYIAVKAHTIAMISHYLEKGNALNILANPYKQFSDSQEECYNAAEYHRMVRFYSGDKELKSTEEYSGLSDVMETLMNNYHHNRNNVPSYMQLSIPQEFEMLRYLHKNGKLHEALLVRYKQLKAEYLIKERSYLGSLNLPQAELLSREKSIDNQLRKDQTILKHTFEIDTLSEIQVELFTPPVLSYNSSNEDPRTIEKYLNSKVNLKLPTSNMTYIEFCSQFMNYYEMAFQNSSKEKDAIKKYCEQTIIANMRIENNSRSIVAHLSGILLKAYAKPESFKDLRRLSSDPMEFTKTINSLFEKGSSINLSVTSKAMCRQLTKEIPLKIKSTPLSVGVKKIYAKPISEKLNKFQPTSKFFNMIALKQAESNKKIEALIEDRYPKSDNFELNDKIVKALDREIGEIRNDFNKKIIEYTKQAMDPKFFNLEEELKKTLNIEADIKKDKDQLVKDLLKFANQYPDDEKEKRKKKLRELGKKRSEISLAELSRLYVLADLNEYKRITGLNAEESERLHQDMSDYIQLGIYEQQYQNKREALEQYIDVKNNSNSTTEMLDGAIARLSGVALSQNIVDISKEPEIQYFQYADHKILYSQQYYYLNQLLKTDDVTQQYKKIIIKLIMAGGKSKVLAPLALLKKANGTNLAIIQVKRGLFNTNFSDLSATSMRLFGQEAVAFQFDRQSSFSAKDLKALYKKLQAIKVERKYLVTTGESLQSLELKYCELLLLDPKNRAEEWPKQIKWLEKTLNLLKYSGDRIIDEVHDELDPNIQLNYTLGESESIPHEDIALEISLFEFFSQVDITDILNKGGQRITIEDVIKNNKLVTQDQHWETIFERLALQLETHPESPLSKLMTKLHYDTKEKTISAYLLNKSDAIIETYQHQLSDRDKDELAFLKSQITKVLPFTLKRNLFEHYGPWPDTDLRKSYLQKMLPIPYKSNNTPNTKARFGNFIENMNYVMQMNAKIPLSDPLITEILDEFVTLAKEEIQQDQTLTFNDTQAFKQLNTHLGEGHQVDLNQWVQQSEEYRNTIIASIRSSKQFKLYCIKDRILPQIQLNPAVLTSNPQNAVSMTRTTQGMSGTPHNFRAMHQDLIFDEKAGLGTDGETLALLKSKNTDVYLCENPDLSADVKPDDVLGLLLTKIPQHKQDLRAIVDVGSLFRGVNNETVARDIIKFYQKNASDALAQLADRKNKIQYVLYFDNQLEVLCALDVLNPAKPIILNTTDEDEIKSTLKCTPNEWFTYYDQARATGTDIAQAHKAHAIVTFSEKTKQSPALQGIKRMRKFAQDQTVTLVGPPYLQSQFKKSLPPGKNSIRLEEVLELFSTNEYHDELKAHLRGTLQKFENVIRDNIMQKIRSEPNLDKKAHLFKVMKSYFVQENKINHFRNMGSITSLAETEKYFETCCSKQLNNWKSLLKKEEMSLESNEENDVKDLLNKIKLQGIAACAAQTEQVLQQPGKDIVPDIGLDSKLGEEVEVETETEREIEIQLELETQQQFYEKNRKPYQSQPYVFNESKSNFDPSQRDLSKLYSLNQALISHPISPTFRFSNQIWMSDLYAHTYADQVQLLSCHTKPVQNILMVQDKSPPYTLNAILLNKNETKAYIPMPEFQKYDVWIISPNNTLISGHRPSKPSSDTDLIIEQIQYFNGDCKLLADSEKPTVWLGEKNQEKFEFMEKAILPFHLVKKPHYNQLRKRFELIKSAIQYIEANPNEDYFGTECFQKISGFKHLKASKQQWLLATALATSIFSHENYKNYFSSDFINQYNDEWIERWIADKKNVSQQSNDQICQIWEACFKAKRDEIYHDIKSQETILRDKLIHCIEEKVPFPSEFPYERLNKNLILSSDTSAGKNVLLFALSSYNFDAIQVLIEKYGLKRDDINEPNIPTDLNLFTFMLYDAAVRYKKMKFLNKPNDYKEIIQTLTKQKTNPPIEFNKLLSNDKIPLQRENEDEKKVIYLLLDSWINQQADKKINYNETTDQGDTVLMIALRLDEIELCSKLINAGCDMHAVNYSQESALSIILNKLKGQVTKKRLEILELILKKSNVNDFNNINFEHNFGANDSTIKKTLLNGWKNAIINSFKESNEIVHDSSMNNIGVNNSSKINAINGSGKTYIEEYIAHDQFDMDTINSVIDAGIDLNMTTKDGTSLFALVLSKCRFSNDLLVKQLHQFDKLTNKTIEDAMDKIKTEIETDKTNQQYGNEFEFDYEYQDNSSIQNEQPNDNDETKDFFNAILDKWREAIMTEAVLPQGSSEVIDLTPLLKKAQEYNRNDIIEDLIVFARSMKPDENALDKLPGLHKLNMPENVQLYNAVSEVDKNTVGIKTTLFKANEKTRQKSIAPYHELQKCKEKTLSNENVNNPDVSINPDADINPSDNLIKTSDINKPRGS